MPTRETRSRGKLGSGYPAMTAVNPDVLFPVLPVEVIVTLRLKALGKKGKGPEGPKHKAWNAKYQKSLAKKLKKLGISKKMIRQIIKEYLVAAAKTLRGDRTAMAKWVAKWILMLIRVKRAIEQEYKEEGAAPKWGE